MGFCTSCGKPLTEGARFCAMCGAPVIAVPEQEPVHPAVPEKPPQAPLGQEPRNRYFSPPEPQPRNRYFGPAGQQPPHGGNYTPPRQQASGGNRPPAGKQLKYRGALRFLSFLFALGLLITAAGLAGRIYFGRYTDSTLDRYVQDMEMTKDVPDRQKQYLSEALAAQIRGEIMTAQIAVYQFENYPKTDTSGLNISGEQQKLLRERFGYFNREGGKQFGIRWTLLQAGARGGTLMITGGVTAAATLLIWLALGGRLRNISRTMITPLLTMFIIWGVCIVVLAFIIDPISMYDVDISGLPYQI